MEMKSLSKAEECFVEVKHGIAWSLILLCIVCCNRDPEKLAKACGDDNCDAMHSRFNRPIDPVESM